MAAIDFACWRSTNFWILPVEVFGSVAKITLRGTLKRAICARQCSMMSASVTCASGLVSTKAHGVSPHFGSGVAHARLRHSIAWVDFARSRSTNFWIFPVDVFGSSPNTTFFGALK